MLMIMILVYWIKEIIVNVFLVNRWWIKYNLIIIDKNISINIYYY